MDASCHPLMTPLLHPSIVTHVLGYRAFLFAWQSVADFLNNRLTTNIFGAWAKEEMEAHKP